MGSWGVAVSSLRSGVSTRTVLVPWALGPWFLAAVHLHFSSGGRAPYSAEGGPRLPPCFLSP